MFQYNHNEHYADLLLHQVPSDCRSALDVGCGDGGFARRLADRFSAAVTGIDQDRAIIERARTLAGDRSIRFVEADFMRYSFDEQFEFIGASASLHHLPFEQALVKMAALLQPGGVLAVLGLFGQTSLTDSAVALVAAPVNVCYSLRRGWFSSGAPIKPPDRSLPEIRETCSIVLPGARLRRLLLWRYLLTWQKPQASAVGPPDFSSGVMGFSFPSPSQSGRQAQPPRKRLRDTVQLDAHLTRVWSACVASQPCLPTQTSMCALCARERGGCQLWAGRDTVLHLHIHALVTQQMHTRLPMTSATPIVPEERGWTNRKGV